MESGELDAILDEGAQRANAYANSTLNRIETAIGLQR